jgi:hypothetical protein
VWPRPYLWPHSGRYDRGRPYCVAGTSDDCSDDCDDNYFDYYTEEGDYDYFTEAGEYVGDGYVLSDYVDHPVLRDQMFSIHEPEPQGPKARRPLAARSNRGRKLRRAHQASQFWARQERRDTLKRAVEYLDEAAPVLRDRRASRRGSVMM